MFPAGAGVILSLVNQAIDKLSVSRRRGGDPMSKEIKEIAELCFPQARG